MQSEPIFGLLAFEKRKLTVPNRERLQTQGQAACTFQQICFGGKY
jgi:hypothetical protein